MDTAENYADSDSEEDRNAFDHLTFLEDKIVDNEQKPSKKEEVKLEEDEVKMEAESESEEEEFDGSKMEPDCESSGGEDLSSSFDSSVQPNSPKQEGHIEHENMKTKKGEIRKRRQKRMPGENPYRPYQASITPCEICGQIFTPSDMVKHMVTHTGARDFKCDICSECFPQLSILNRFDKIYH